MGRYASDVRRFARELAGLRKEFSEKQGHWRVKGYSDIRVKGEIADFSKRLGELYIGINAFRIKIFDVDAGEDSNNLIPVARALTSLMNSVAELKPEHRSL